jgi:serine/threonine-protein kinase
VTLTPGGTLGNYQIAEKIGAGGMGSVYKAYQPALGRYVAIKVLPPQTAGDPSFAARFALEARAIGKLRHPNIVTAYEFSTTGDLAYLVSDFIDGGTLADQLGAPLPLEYALTILTPIASALDYAHARGVVHRDIKPQNILLTHDGTPVLTDFGLAKIIGPGSGVTQAGALIGTAEYIAPECASGAESAGPAADQYAIALVAYQLLVGRHPFPSDNPLSALMAHVHKPVPVPTAIGVPLAPHVEAALLRGLAKKPEERFARVSDFARALSGVAPAASAPLPTIPAEALAPTAETPKPTRLPPAEPTLSVSTATPTAAPWWRRRRTLLIAGGILILVLVLAALNSRFPAGGDASATDDHGNTIATATVITPGTHTGTIAPAGDVDVFRLNVPASTNIVVELHFDTLQRGSVAIMSGGGLVLDEASDSAPRVARANYNAKDGGAYYIRVSSDRNTTGTYWIVVIAR